MKFLAQMKGAIQMKESKINLLIVDDEEQFLESITKSLQVRDFNVVAVNRGDKAIEAANQHPIDVALVDLRMPGISGEETLKALKKQHRWMEVIILTGHGTIDSAVDAIKEGAYEYLQKPCSLDELLETLKNAYKKKVMNKKDIDAAKMREMLSLSLVESPLGILRRLKEIDKGA
jgi:DNA-binding NtrC family response regulator